MEKIPFTPQGLIVIKEELAHLKGTERQAVINAIAAAREHGCLLYTSPSPRDISGARMPSSA